MTHSFVRTLSAAVAALAVWLRGCLSVEPTTAYAQCPPYWDRLGTGTTAAIYALAEYDGAIYAGGWFTTAGGQEAYCIARWNGAMWAAVGSGTNGNVNALAVYDGALYAAGSFTTAGGQAVNNIAKWNGSIWSAVGSGVDNAVNALAVSNGVLYAGGAFTTAGGAPA
ncbi:MAG: hypothetical protein ACUVXJ_19220, partial [Phycisphaerae bacterium]